MEWHRFSGNGVFIQLRGDTACCTRRAEFDMAISVAARKAEKKLSLGNDGDGANVFGR